MENTIYAERPSLAYWAKRTSAHPSLMHGMDRRFDSLGGTYYQSSVRKH